METNEFHPTTASEDFSSSFHYFSPQGDGNTFNFVVFPQTSLPFITFPRKGMETSNCADLYPNLAQSFITFPRKGMETIYLVDTVT